MDENWNFAVHLWWLYSREMRRKWCIGMDIKMRATRREFFYYIPKCSICMHVCTWAWRGIKAFIGVFPCGLLFTLRWSGVVRIRNAKYLYFTLNTMWFIVAQAVSIESSKKHKINIFHLVVCSFTNKNIKLSFNDRAMFTNNHGGGVMGFCFPRPLSRVFRINLWNLKINIFRTFCMHIWWTISMEYYEKQTYFSYFALPYIYKKVGKLVREPHSRIQIFNKYLYWISAVSHHFPTTNALKIKK